jgi:hypothetical protein
MGVVYKAEDVALMASGLESPSSFNAENASRYYRQIAVG